MLNQPNPIAMKKSEATTNTETVKSPEKIKWLSDHGGGAISC
jgi:hypothetical protein